MRSRIFIGLFLITAVALVAGLYPRDNGVANAPRALITDPAKPVLDETEVQAEVLPSELPGPGDGRERAANVEQLAQEIIDQSIIISTPIFFEIIGPVFTRMALQRAQNI